MCCKGAQKTNLAPRSILLDLLTCTGSNLVPLDLRLTSWLHLHSCAKTDVCEDPNQVHCTTDQCSWCLLLQIFCTHSEPNFSLPWQRKRQYSSTSSGFITAGQRILTNAHCVDHHTQVGPTFHSLPITVLCCIQCSDISAVLMVVLPA